MPKTRKVQVLGSLQAVQSDWEQTDATQLDYIKNKPNSGEVIATSIQDGILVLEQNPGIVAKGNDGYTPIKGVDYFTEADKQELIDAILAVLPEGGQTVYVIGEPVVFTLEAALWNGTTYTIETAEYGEVGDVQIGIPPNSSLLNTETVSKCAITLPYISNNQQKVDVDGDGDYDENVLEYKSTTFKFSAVTIPTIDVEVAVYGLLGGVANE